MNPKYKRTKKIIKSKFCKRCGNVYKTHMKYSRVCEDCWFPGTHRMKKNMIGKTKISVKEKEVLRGLVKHTCQQCILNENLVGKLTPHRITRGNQGGTYAPNNIKMLCSACHKAFHYGEFR